MCPCDSAPTQLPDSPALSLCVPDQAWIQDRLHRLYRLCPSAVLARLLCPGDMGTVWTARRVRVLHETPCALCSVEVTESNVTLKVVNNKARRQGF